MRGSGNSIQNISNREAEVLKLITEELTTKEIAERLYISDHTVISHRKTLLSKMGAKNTAGLVRRAYEHGLLRLAMSVTLLMTFCATSTFAQDKKETKAGYVLDVGFEVAKGKDVLFGAVDFNDDKTVFQPVRSALFMGGSHDISDGDLDDLVGNYSISVGNLSKMYGNYSFSMGYDNHSFRNHTFAFGYLDTIRSARSAAWGRYHVVEADSEGSMVWGESNTSSDTLGTVWGINNTVSGDKGTAWGENNESLGEGSTVWGRNNEATGLGATAWGQQNESSGSFSSSLGSNNKAESTYSTAAGYGLITRSHSVTAVGTYNDTILSEPQSSFPFLSVTDRPMFVVGNGGLTLLGGSYRSNAMIVTKAGRVGIGNLGLPATDLAIRSSENYDDGYGTGGISLIKASDDGEPESWVIHHGFFDKLVFSRNGDMKSWIGDNGSYNVGIPAALFLDDSVTLKKAKSMSKSLAKIVVGQDTRKSASKELTLDYAKLMKDFPHLVIKSQGETHIAVDYKQLYLLAIATIQEQEEKINQQENAIAEILTRVAALEEK